MASRPLRRCMPSVVGRVGLDGGPRPCGAAVRARADARRRRSLARARPVDRVGHGRAARRRGPAIRPDAEALGGRCDDLLRARDLAPRPPGADAERALDPGAARKRGDRALRVAGHRHRHQRSHRLHGRPLVRLHPRGGHGPPPATGARARVRDHRGQLDLPGSRRRAGGHDPPRLARGRHVEDRDGPDDQQHRRRPLPGRGRPPRAAAPGHARRPPRLVDREPARAGLARLAVIPGPVLSVDRPATG